jgi:hypothetical protein
LIGLANDAILRVRPLGSNDEWCLCQVGVTSTSGNSLGLLVLEGALRVRSGIMSGAVLVSIEEGHAFETITNTELEIEMKR